MATRKTCLKCPKKSFDSMSKYNQHLKTHTKPFGCELCDKAFALRSDLSRHILAKHRVGQSKFECSYCDFKASRKDNLGQHMRKTHGHAPKRKVPQEDPSTKNYKEKQNSKSHNVDMRTSLLQAASIGSIAFIQEALQAGADLNLTGDDGSTLLHCAARTGQRLMLEKLIALGASITAENEKRRTPLHEAVFSQDYRTFEFLLDNKADPHTKDCMQNSPVDYMIDDSRSELLQSLFRSRYARTLLELSSPLHKAVKSGQNRITTILISDPSININCTKKNDLTPLHFAVKYNNITAARQLLSRNDINVNERKSEKGRDFTNGLVTPLMYRHKENMQSTHKLEIMALLLQHPKINPNVKDKYGDTALHRAVESRALEEVKLLLEHPALDPNLIGGKGQKAWECAIQKQCPEIVRSWFGNEKFDPRWLDSHRYSKLHFAVMAANTQMVAGVLQSDSVDINAKDWHGDAPLNIATRSGYAAIVKQLLCHRNCNPNVQGRRSETPLHTAIIQKNTELGRVLLQRADILVSVLNRNGDRPLHTACDYQNSDILSLLLSHDPLSINAQNHSRQTPLHIACMAQNPTCLKLLMDQERIQVNILDHTGSTPLHCACSKGKTEAVRILLSREDVQVNLKDKYGDTALHSLVQCRSWNQQECLEITQLFLEDQRIDVNLENNLGETVLDATLRYRLFTLADLLRSYGALTSNELGSHLSNSGSPTQT